MPHQRLIPLPPNCSVCKGSLHGHASPAYLVASKNKSTVRCIARLDLLPALNHIEISCLCIGDDLSDILTAGNH